MRRKGVCRLLKCRKSCTAGRCLSAFQLEWYCLSHLPSRLNGHQHINTDLFPMARPVKYKTSEERAEARRRDRRAYYQRCATQSASRLTLTILYRNKARECESARLRWQRSHGTGHEEPTTAGGEQAQPALSATVKVRCELIVALYA